MQFRDYTRRGYTASNGGKISWEVRCPYCGGYAAKFFNSRASSLKCGHCFQQFMPEYGLDDEYREDIDIECR